MPRFETTARNALAAGMLAAVLPVSGTAACGRTFEKLRYEERSALLAGEGAVSAAFGGEVRQRYEYTHRPLFGGDPQDDAGAWLQRYTLHGDLRAGARLRLFGQLLSAFETGRKEPGPVDENRLVVQNAFAELAGGGDSSAGVVLRAGRQELQLGSGRLVDVREGPNVRRTFDALRIMGTVSGWRVSVLAARPRRVRDGVFDDRTDPHQALWGVYATLESRHWPGNADVYFLGYHNDHGIYAQGTADERRQSFGARLWGEHGAWDWNWEAVYQLGTFGADDIRAWTLASETGHTWRDAAWQPRLAVSANIASGDEDPADGDLGTFNPLFPRGNYFSEAAVLGPRNFYNVHTFVTVLPREHWSLTADINAYWRLESGDGVYAPSGRLIRAAGGEGDFVGTALSLTTGHNLSEALTLTAIYTRFAPGRLIESTGPGADIHFFELTLQFRF